MATADSHNAAQDMSVGAHSQHVDASNENVPGDSNSNGVHSDASSLVDHVHEKSAPAAKVTKKEKFKRHCGRFWWWYLIAGIILLAILLPILFTVIVPAIVQAIVNSQQLPVHSGFFKAVSPSELLVSLNTTLNTDIFSVQVDALTMYLSQDSDVDKWPFSNFTLPAMHVKGDTYAILNKQACPITNSTQLTSWVANLFDNPTVDLHVEGNPGIHMGALHSTPHLSKTLTLPALNKLEGKAIDNLELILEGDGEGNNIQGSLNLPNNGILGLDFGNLTLGLSSGSLAIGHVTLNNVALYPGNNSVAFKGFLNLKTLFSNLGTVLASQAQALSKGNIDLNATATSVIVNGEHIPYVENVLTQRTLTFSINAVTLVADVLASLLHGNKKSLDTLIQDIVGNKTLMNEISNNWNRTGGAQELSQIGANQMNRLKSRESLTWELLKLSMKMNRNKF